MGMTTCEYHGKRSGLIDLIHRLANSVAGGGNNGISPEAVRSIHLRMGVSLLSKVQQNFIVLSRGGQSEGGYSWKPLSRATIAARRTTAAEKRTLGIGGKRERGLLTPAQNKRWKSIFGSRLAKLVLQGMAEGEAKARAAQIAWAILKAEGAQTKLAILGGRKVDIGRDTWILFRSLTPGIDDKPSGADGQVFDVTPGTITVGTNVPYASSFHAVRPLWPERLPESWREAINGAAVRGVALALADMLGGKGAS